MVFNPDKHHRRSIRLKDFDYSQPGAYFITICTYNRECLLGDVVNSDVLHSVVGQVAVAEWVRSAQIRREIVLDEFIVMPNHIHGVVMLSPPDAGATNPVPSAVGATGRSPLPKGPSPKSIGAFVAGYKSSVTKRINEIRNTPGAPVWQRNYYEHVIRNEDELNRKREYIRNNPSKWESDSENPLNLKTKR